MSETVRERILEATETLLRRLGPGKLAVTDVARVLGMSHGNIYRHFTSKADLLDAIAERWLGNVSAPLAILAAGDEPAAERLESWTLTLMRIKWHKVHDDPEVFAMYHSVAEASHDVVTRHVITLLDQLEQIVADGCATGEFQSGDPRQAALAIWNATIRFHHPSLVRALHEPPTEAEVRTVMALLVAGLKAGVT